MTYHQKQLCALMAAALSSTAFAATSDIPAINDGFVYAPTSNIYDSVLELDYNKLPVERTGAIDFAGWWKN